MNERFAVEPSACDSWVELKFLLEKFGPETGRYIVRCPGERWLSLVRKHFEALSDDAQKKVLELLVAAKDRHALIQEHGLDLHQALDWIHGVRLIQSSPRKFDGVVVSRTNKGEFPSLEEIYLPPTAEKRVPATAAEYAHASDILLRHSNELHFIDPYMDPCNAACRKVLKAMIGVAAQAKKCQAVHLWLRGSRLDQKGRTQQEVSESLRATAHSACFIAPNKIFLHAFNDAGCKTDIHYRYLLSRHGAIRFEHGFQQLNFERSATITPQPRDSHETLMLEFIEGQHDMRVESFDIDLR